MKRRAVFLDRDGVLNAAVVREGKLYPPPSVREVVIPDGVESACRDLRHAGFLLIVVTNQPDVARGTQSRAVVEEINRHLGERVAVDDFRVCYHDDADQCDCRKPRPGLMTAAAVEWNVDLERSFMVGDRSKDMMAGVAAGCRTVFVTNGSPAQSSTLPDFSALNLREAADWILAVDALQRPRLP